MTSPLVIAQGTAGTAKSFVEASAAIELLTDKKSPVEQIIITRSPVPTGRSTGFKPGEADEKMAPWVAPIMDNILKATLSRKGGDGFFRYLKGAGKIKVLELESIKGTNIDNAVVIVEEGQELLMEELKNLVTRVG